MEAPPTSAPPVTNRQVISIIYQTSRKNPRFHWFIDSLFAQWKDSGAPIKLIVVDFYADHSQRKEAFAVMAREFISRGVRFVHTSPAPSVWQGPHRLTSRDFFAAANSRNTGICYADDGYIVFVDDLSVLLPGWFQQVQEAVAGGWIACGAYSKVKDLVVENGIVKSFLGLPNGFEAFIPPHFQVFDKTEHKAGLDSRLKHAPDSSAPYKCAGQWLFGCSAAIPVEALLKVNGFHPFADSLGGEDYLAGLSMEQHGYKFKYCHRMFTLESEEAHGEEPPFIRIDKGISPNDSSHALLRLVQKGETLSPHPYYLRELRQKILAGEPFPIPTDPKVHWWDKEPLERM